MPDTTALVSLPGASGAPPTTAFAVPVADNDAALAAVVHQIRSARCIVVVCGAGVSTAAAIPDFRSASGLFKGKGKGRAGNVNVHDLFHVKSLTSPSLLPAHHSLLNHLYDLSTSAQPTPFHTLLHTLDTQGRLLRCYTQNIDGLEEKAGLATGIPPKPVRARRPRKGAVLATPPSQQAAQSSSPLPSSPPSSSLTACLTSSHSRPAAASDTPHCIPLHGTMTHMACTLCLSTFPIADFLPLPPTAISCPACAEHSTIRRALAERPRRAGHLRVGVTLYGEEHAQGEAIGAVVERDLKGRPARSAADRRAVDTAGTATTAARNAEHGFIATPPKQPKATEFYPSPSLTASPSLGPTPTSQPSPTRQRAVKPDLLLVAGTSLSIPGVRRIVREFARAVVRPTRAGSPTDTAEAAALAATAVPAVFVNAEPPARASEWARTFGTWVRGDVQALVALVADDNYVVPEPIRAAVERAPRRAPTAKRTAAADADRPSAKRAKRDTSPVTPARRAAAPYPTPRATPPSPSGKTAAHHGHTLQPGDDGEAGERGSRIEEEANPFLAR